MTQTAIYCPEIFDSPDIEAAKEVILTNEGPGADTAARWAGETPFVLELIRQAVDLQPQTLVLDYGCGIGRLAKAMIDATGCSVLGVDTSPAMRRLAVDYVGSDRFTPLSPAQLKACVAHGLRVDAVICVWVLQHCLSPGEDIARMTGSLAPGGRGFVLNMPVRAIPARVTSPAGEARFSWVSDQVDVAALLRAAFDVTAEGLPDPSRTPNMADAGAFWMHLRRRAP